MPVKTVTLFAPLGIRKNAVLLKYRPRSSGGTFRRNRTVPSFATSIAVRFLRNINSGYTLGRKTQLFFHPDHTARVGICINTLADGGFFSLSKGLGKARFYAAVLSAPPSFCALFIKQTLTLSGRGRWGRNDVFKGRISGALSPQEGNPFGGGGARDSLPRAFRSSSPAYYHVKIGLIAFGVLID